MYAWGNRNGSYVVTATFALLAIAAFAPLASALDFSNVVWNFEENALIELNEEDSIDNILALNYVGGATPSNGTVTITSSGLTGGAGEILSGDLASYFLLASGAMTIKVETTDFDEFYEDGRDGVLLAEGVYPFGGMFTDQFLTATPVLTITIEFTNAVFSTVPSTPMTFTFNATS